MNLRKSTTKSIIQRSQTKNLTMSDRSKRKNFAFYGIFQEMLKSLPDEARLKMYDAIIDYGIGRTPPSFQGDKYKVLEESLWKFFKEKLDLSHKRYEASLKGGAPKGNSNGKKHNGEESGPPEDNQIQPNPTKSNQGTTTYLMKPKSPAERTRIATWQIFTKIPGHMGMPPRAALLAEEIADINADVSERAKRIR